MPQSMQTRLQQRQQIEKLLQSGGIYHGLQARSAIVGARAAKAGDDSENNIRFILTTEMPATVFDWRQYDFVEEVLLMEGMMVPAIKQVPFLDSHNRRSVDDVMGHVSDFADLTVEEFAAKDGLVSFAADEKSQRTKQKIIDRHLTDGSVGYEVLKSIWIPEGEEAAVNGRIFAGPVKVSYQWLLKEYSATPIGADVLAKVRAIIH